MVQEEALARRVRGEQDLEVVVALVFADKVGRQVGGEDLAGAERVRLLLVVDLVRPAGAIPPCLVRLPVAVGPLPDFHALASGVADGFVGAGADAVLEALDRFAAALGDLLGDDEVVLVGHGAQEVGLRLLELELDRLVVDSSDAFDVGVVTAARRADVGVLDALEGPLDVFSGDLAAVHRCAVVELGFRVQLEGDGEAVVGDFGQVDGQVGLGLVVFDAVANEEVADPVPEACGFERRVRAVDVEHTTNRPADVGVHATGPWSFAGAGRAATLRRGIRAVAAVAAVPTVVVVIVATPDKGEARSANCGGTAGHEHPATIRPPLPPAIPVVARSHGYPPEDVGHTSRLPTGT